MPLHPNRHPHSTAVRKLDYTDSALDFFIPKLAITQSQAHDTVLPDQKNYGAQMAQNFRDAVRDNHVEIWCIDDPQIGAVFLPPRKAHTHNALHIDDIVILPEYRRQGFGSALIAFVAALAQSRGMNRVTWECEEGNPAAHMYIANGAEPQKHVKPFRLTRKHLDTMIAHHDISAVCDDFTYTLTNRFSLFRAASHGIQGFDMVADEYCVGAQIEDIEFNDMDKAYHALCALIYDISQKQPLDFIDLVLDGRKENHMALVVRYDAQQNSYSGNPALIWTLLGDGFQQASTRGQDMLKAAL